MNVCSADSCIVNDKSKDREKRKIVCAGPGCSKEFHTRCIGRPKVSDKELNNMFFLCTRCETYLSYSADMSRKSIMSEMDCKIKELKESLFKVIDEKITSECSKISARTNCRIDSISKSFGEKIEELRSQTTQANTFALNFVHECDQRMKEMHDEMSKIKTHRSDELEEAKKSLKSIVGQVASLDLQKRKKHFVIRNFPENTCLIKGKCVSTPKDAVDAVAEALNINCDAFCVKDVHRIGKPREDGSARVLLVKADEKTVKRFLMNARFLKNAPHPLNRVFVQEDLPPEVNRKIAEMRKRAYEYRASNPGKTAFVRGKRLYIDGNLVDEVKLGL